MCLSGPTMGKDNSAAAPIPGRARIFYSSSRPHLRSRSSPESSATFALRPQFGTLSSIPQPRSTSLIPSRARATDFAGRLRSFVRGPFTTAHWPSPGSLACRAQSAPLCWCESRRRVQWSLLPMTLGRPRRRSAPPGSNAGRGTTPGERRVSQRAHLSRSASHFRGAAPRPCAYSKSLRAGATGNRGGRRSG